MALDGEELKRRRQERDALRRKRLRQQRILILGLLAAAAVLLLCGLLIFAMTRRGGSPVRNTEPHTENTAAVSTNPTEVIHFAAAGDLHITDRVVASGGANGDFAKVFQDVLPVLAGADLTSVNLEGLVCGAPYGTQTASAPESLLRALANAGVDMVQMANSYSLNNGLGGLAASLKAIRAAGMEPLGAYADKEEFEMYDGFSLYDVRGVKVGVFAMTKGMGGISLPVGNAVCVNVLYDDYATTYQTVNTDRISHILESVEREKPDIVIALLHWGSEYDDNQSKSQKKIQKLLLEGGVDVIIGTHPHYVQQVTRDEETGAIVAYSLGDFLGDADRSGTEYSIILDLEITKDNVTGETLVTDWKYIPTYTVWEEDGTARVVRLEEAMVSHENGEIGCVSDAVYQNMTAALEKIKERVTPVVEEG